MGRVVVVNYDPCWPETFERLRARIWPCVRDVATAVEHVGSTSVPGLAAKPIIDMTIVVPGAHAMGTVIERLATIGYRHQGDLGVPGREAFASPSGAPDHHLYACVAGSEGMRNHLALRDHLRGDPAAARQYGALKRRLAAQLPDDIDGYVEGKTEFILGVLTRAGFSPEQIRRIRAANSRPVDGG